jgi:decaprenylphospho-beta-D-ribofuranose 2-oxidase
MPVGPTFSIPIRREQLRTYGGQMVATNVATPSDQAELRIVLTDAERRRLQVVFRGGGRSFDTQSLNAVYVISLEKFARISAPDLERRCITVGASASWGAILRATAPHGLVPYVTVTSSRATAGGTLSADCLSRFSPSCGKEGAHVRSFEFMGLDGQARSCSRTQNPELFKAVISGLGCLGVVYEITYELLKLDIPPDQIAVKTEFIQIRGLKHLAEQLVNRVHEHQTQLCAQANALAESAHASCTTIAAARVAPQEVAAISAVLYLNSARQGLLMKSQYVQAKPEQLKPCFLHQPERGLHRVLQLAALTGLGRRLGWWLALNYFFKGATEQKPLEFTDELFGFTFFQDGNEALHERGRSYGLPVATLQQTYVIPWDPEHPLRSSQRLAKFLEAADELLDASGLLPALIDVLYVPDDAGEGFLLSSSRNLSGFAVTFTFERLLSSDFPGERSALREIATYCEQAQGRVHLVKHVYADVALLDRMYGPGLDELIPLKKQHDPQNTLRSDFLQRVFPRLFA